MEHTWKAVLAVATVAILGIAGAARADLNINGETGLILNPTAEIVQKGHPQIQANYYHMDGGYNDKFYGLYGAIQASDNLEVSAGIDKFKSDYEPWDRSGFDVGVKYQLLKQSEKGFDLAIGAGYDRGLNNNTRVYAAATKAFGNANNRAPIKGTVGVRWDRVVNFDEGFNYHSSQVSAFAGVEVPVIRNGELSLIGEIQSKNINDDFYYNAKFPYAIGLRYSPHDQAFSVTSGLQRQGIETPFSNGSEFFVQVGYTFGK
jgi:hypothetical protein